MFRQEATDRLLIYRFHCSCPEKEQNVIFGYFATFWQFSPKPFDDILFACKYLLMGDGGINLLALKVICRSGLDHFNIYNYSIIWW